MSVSGGFKICNPFPSTVRHMVSSPERARSSFKDGELGRGIARITEQNYNIVGPGVHHGDREGDISSTEREVHSERRVDVQIFAPVLQVTEEEHSRRILLLLGDIGSIPCDGLV